MVITGVDSVAALHELESYLIKFVANDSAAFFFPHTTEHRDAKLVGLSYEDESKGNAIAAIVKPGLIEIRRHREFSIARVRRIVECIRTHPDVSFLSSFEVRYGGSLIISSVG